MVKREAPQAASTAVLDGALETATAGIEIDLGQLSTMHPRLPADLALLLSARAGLGLQRNDHRPGARIQLDIDQVPSEASLAWPAQDLNEMEEHDSNRIIEDGAEAVVLAVAHRLRAWCIVRRLQREEHADWLLEHQSSGARQLIALEVSGVDRGTIGPRLKRKLAQVAGSLDVDQRWAGVVGFESPEAALRPAGSTGHGS